jgi:hypothetical protein
MVNNELILAGKMGGDIFVILRQENKSGIFTVRDLSYGFTSGNRWSHIQGTLSEVLSLLESYEEEVFVFENAKEFGEWVAKNS